VIEGFDAAPRLLAVAAVAFLAELAFVRIVRLVTIETPPGSLAVFRAAGVATVAARSLVGLDQCEIGERMVERLAIELDDVELAPFVVGVAELAVGLRRFRVAAMEPALASPISRDLLVARKAKPSLRLTRKRLVTAVAVLFELCVPGDQRPRHDQLFEYAL
jgi:hypothetical protein